MPKRQDQRRKKGEFPGLERAAGAVEVPVPALRPGLHPLAVRFYEALEASGQSRFYEPSDWVMAQVACEAIDEYMANPGRAALLENVLKLSSGLLVTEGDRRRLRLELMRVDEGALFEDARAEATISDLRARLTAGA